MLSTDDWVSGCYAYYKENDYEINNPEDGDWEQAHHPTPKCKGGTNTIALLKQHHAMHGVLQSEEQNYPCIYGWEANYLEGEMLALCKKWHAEKTRIANKRRTPESNRARGIKAAAAQTPQQRRDKALKREANKTPEQRHEAAKRAAAARDPQKLRERALKLNATLTPEQKSERARKGNETRRRNREKAQTITN